MREDCCTIASKCNAHPWEETVTAGRAGGDKLRGCSWTLVSGVRNSWLTWIRTRLSGAPHPYLCGMS